MFLRGAIGLAAAFALAGGVLAHSPTEGEGDASHLDCEHLPGAALTSLPSPFHDAARIECGPSGQFLVQGADWIWRYPGSFTTQVHVPAWTPDPSSAAGRYFTRADVSVQRGAQAAELHRRLVEQMAPHSPFAAGDEPWAPREITSLRAENDLGQALQVHLVQLDGRNDLWGIVCAPDCRSEYSFIATSR